MREKGTCTKVNTYYADGDRVSCCAKCGAEVFRCHLDDKGQMTKVVLNVEYTHVCGVSESVTLEPRFTPRKGFRRLFKMA